MEREAYCIITTTVDSQELAGQITSALLEAKLVACVQEQHIQSSYHWNGKIEKNREILLQMKTKTIHFENIERTIKKLHSYEIPEIIMSPVYNANRDYLSWIDKEVSNDVS